MWFHKQFGRVLFQIDEGMIQYLKRVWFIILYIKFRILYKTIKSENGFFKVKLEKQFEYPRLMNKLVNFLILLH